ncbi:dNTP triphosphohydrolase [Altericroceibacterium spongiae]|uniref:DNTP triphosphohydrolase n=1 Tax=Altericroceibacterium spongiae TaxID=2320269 RepID=A0A420ES05_9SPHN|nr:anti-phage deoxyguanosine triphosphatase [Altericroceibacterium spongiae]RKF23465.1 dNTP triphosphohydrolase [Altericroceibacterium spongiae]
MTWLDRRTAEKPKDFDARTPGDVDYGRVVHSASFRRLQGKTQILNLGDSDFYRTRLTHSLEVAQIAGGIARQLGHKYPDHAALPYLPEGNLLQAIACTHDLGHPPFGHGGEIALNYCMRDNGGFEGNGQTLRILSRLEKFSRSSGSNLTRETLLGVLKYPVPHSQAVNKGIRPAMVPDTSGIPLLDRTASKPPKCYLDCEEEVVDWILEPLSRADREQFQLCEKSDSKHARSLHKAFACSIMDLADDISFAIHDMEDALALKLVEPAGFYKHIPPEKCDGLLEYLTSQYSDDYGNDAYGGLVDRLFGSGDRRKHQINRIFNYIIPRIEIRKDDGFAEPRLAYRVTLPDPVLRFVKAAKDFIWHEVIQNPSVQHLEFKGQMMVIAVFEVMKSDPEHFLPRDFYEKCQAQNADPLRIICDYVAGMTDSYLLQTYERLFAPRMGSVFDKL